MRASEYERAEAEFKELVKAAQRETTARSPPR
jgi:hypothetical protein